MFPVDHKLWSTLAPISHRERDVMVIFLPKKISSLVSLSLSHCSLDPHGVMTTTTQLQGNTTTTPQQHINKNNNPTTNQQQHDATINNMATNKTTKSLISRLSLSLIALSILMVS